MASNYTELKEDFFDASPRRRSVYNNASPLLTNDEIPKYIKAFNKKKNVDKLNTFLDWVELPKLPQDKVIYDQIKDFQFYQDTTLTLQFSAEVSLIASSLMSQTLAVCLPYGIQLINSKNGALLKLLFRNEETELVYSVVLGEKNMFLGGRMCEIEVFLYIGEEIERVEALRGHECDVYAMALFSENILVSGDCKGEVFVWDLNNKTSRHFVNSADEAINTIVATPNKEKIIIAGDNNVINVWNLKDLTLIASLVGHDERITCLAISHNGDRLASGGEDRMIKIWDLHEFKEKFSLEGHEETINALAFLPNGKTLASGGDDNIVKLWSSSKGRLKTTIEGHTDSITSFSLTSNGTLISGSKDKTIRGWSLSKFRNTKVLVGNKGAVYALIWIRNSPYVLSAGNEKEIRVWNVEKAQKVIELLTNSPAILSLAIDCNCNKFASGGIDGTLTLWSMDIYAPSFKQASSATKHLQAITCIQFAYNGGETIITGSLDQTIKIWDPSLNILKEIPKHPGLISTLCLAVQDCILVTGTKFSGLYTWDLTESPPKNLKSLQGHSGEITVLLQYTAKEILSAGKDGKIFCWAVESGTSLWHIQAHSSGVLSLVITHDGLRMISGGEDQSLFIWDLAHTHRLLVMAKNYTEGIRAMALEPNSYRIIAAGQPDFNLRIADINKIKTTKILYEFGGPVNSVALSHDEQLLAMGDNKHCVKVWDLLNYKWLGGVMKHTGKILKVKFHPDGKRLFSCGGDNSVRIWDISSPAYIKLIRILKSFSDSVHDVEFYDNANKAVFACASRFLVFYDLENYELIMGLHEHADSVYTLAVDQSQQRLYSAGLEGKILCFALKQQPEFVECVGDHEACVRCVVLTAEGKRLISCGDDQMIKFWRLADKKIVHKIQAHSNIITKLLINDKGNKLYSGSLDETIQIWDINNYKRLAVMEAEPVNDLATNKDNIRLYSANSDHKVRIWDIDDSEPYPFFQGHFDEIWRIGLASDEKFLISASWDQQVIIWDLKEKKQRNKLKGHQAKVMGLAISSNGSRVITCDDKENVRIWEPIRQRNIASFHLESSGCAIILTPDDKEMIIGCKDSIIRVYDVISTRFVKKFIDGHTSLVQCLLISRDRKTLYSGGEDKLIVIWDYFSRSKLKVLEGHEGAVYTIAFFTKTMNNNINNNKLLLSGSKDKTMRLWNLESGEYLSLIYEEFPNNVRKIVVTKDNKKIFVACSCDTLFIFDANTLKISSTISQIPFSVYDAILSDNEKLLYLAGNKSIAVYDAETFGFCYKFEGFSAKKSQEILSPDKKMIVFATADEFLVRVWDLKEGLKGEHRLHTKRISALLMSKDNQKVFSASEDKTIICYNHVFNSSIKRRAHSAAITTLALTNSENLLISAGEDNTIKVWSLPEIKKFAVFDTDDDDCIHAVAVMSDDSSFLAGGTGKRLSLWNCDDGFCETVAILSDSVMGLMFSPNRQKLVVYLKEGKMLILETKKYSFLHEMKLRENNFMVFPQFLSDKLANNRLMLYFDDLIDCVNGQTVFHFETNREINSFFFDEDTNSYFYITPQYELFRLQEYWLMTYLYQYLKTDSLTLLNKKPEEFVKRACSTFPFFFSFLHLVSVFEKTEYFSRDLLEEVYENQVKLSVFYQQDIFLNTPLDILLLKMNTTLINKYFSLFFYYFEKEDVTFNEKVRFLNYSFKENYDIRHLMCDLMKNSQPDLQIVSKLLDLSYMSFDPSIYNNSLVFKELEFPLYVNAKSVYIVDERFIQEKVENVFEKLGISRKTEDKTSMIKANIVCIPKICDFNEPQTLKFWRFLADCDSNNEIFGNKVLTILAYSIWFQEIKFYFMVEFGLFFFIFVLFKVNFIVLYPLRVNIYYADDDTEETLNLISSIIVFFLLIYGVYSSVNEYRQMSFNGVSNYFKSIWNYFDIILIPLLILAASCDFTRTQLDLDSSSKITIKCISALCIFCLWFRFLSFFRAMTATASMIRLIFKVIDSSRHFVLFMVIFMLCLSCSFYVLHTDNLDEMPSFWDTVMVFYGSTIGNTDDLTEYDLAVGKLTDFYLIFSTFLFAIILLNLLVSIIGDIHGEIKEAGEKTRLYELINILVDTNFSLTTRLVKKWKSREECDEYLVQIYNEKHEEKEKNPYEELEKNIQTSLKSINKENEELIKENSEKIEKVNEKIEKLSLNIEKLFGSGWEKVRDYIENQSKNENEKEREKEKEKEKK